MKKIVLLFSLIVLMLAPSLARADNLTPQFGFIAPGWLPIQSFDLSNVWHAFGKQESGVSYYSIGAPLSGNQTWERFDPAGATYEAFFGAYVISNWPFASEWSKPDLQPADIQGSVNELVALGNIDQFAWLNFYNGQFGGPTGSSLVSGSLSTTKADNGYFLVTFAVNTFSDLGSTSPPAPFVPVWSTASGVAQWQPLVAEAAVLIKYDAVHANFVAIHGSGANYALLDGTNKNTPLSTLTQIGQMMAATTFH